MKQPPNLERLPCKSKFSSERKIIENKKWNRTCFSCENNLKGSQFKFKKVEKNFLNSTSAAKV